MLQASTTVLRTEGEEKPNNLLGLLSGCCTTVHRWVLEEKKRGKYAGAEKFLPRRRRSLSRAAREGEIAIEKQEEGENKAPL